MKGCGPDTVDQLPLRQLMPEKCGLHTRWWLIRNYFPEILRHE